MKFLRKVCAASPAREAASYLWFVTRGDGSIESGWEYKEDAKDALKDLEDKSAKIVSRIKLDKAKLAEFWKKAGVSEKMAADGLKAARKAQKPWSPS